MLRLADCASKLVYMCPSSRELCSYTHPALLEGGGNPQRFRGLNDLKRQLQIQRGLQFCPICLEGRKVCRL